MKKKRGRRKSTDTIEFNIPPIFLYVTILFSMGVRLAWEIKNVHHDFQTILTLWLFIFFIIVGLFIILGLQRPFYRTRRIEHWRYREKTLLVLYFFLVTIMVGEAFKYGRLLIPVYFICLFYVALLAVRNGNKLFEIKPSIDHVSLKEVDQMSGTEFEVFLSKLYRGLGYKVEVTPHTDFGIDLIVVKDGMRSGIQAKCYGEGRTVGVAAVNEVCGGAGYWNVQNKVVITNRVFTKKAMITARSNNVIMIDRNDLQELIDDYNKMVNSKEYIPPPSA
ncbi:MULTISPECIES: restriction endonuclease [Bhargavaea]|uniref:Restriction endonuclease n=1 Tax=Bhargavaea changchunensis TaxID=2134037 RepID=A0ABW2NHS6_9BACL|nr:restriction endonuclease [Bhargavaea sp. CC-171006]